MLEANDLTRTDPATGRTLLDVPQFRLDAGQRVGVQGPTGSGKSLLLRAIAWLDRLDGGEIRFHGRQIHHDAVPGYRARVTYLHQKAALYGAVVESALASPFRLNIHRLAQYDRGAALAWFDRFGREKAFLNQSIRELSGGEIQLTALVRALLLEPEVLLLDEPTAALDPATAGRVEEALAAWIAERPDCRALLWVSHDPQQTERLANRTIRVESGRLYEAPTP